MTECTLRAKCLAEFVGTFVLVFTMGRNVLTGNAIWGGLSSACVDMVAIYALGGISGANFNPAVSLALGLCKKLGGPGLDMRTVGLYCAAQVAAGIAAALCYATVFWDTFHLAPAQGFRGWEAGLCELLYTFMLCFVVLNVALAKDNAPNEYYGLAIGFVVAAGWYGAGAVSGGCFNPAVAIGIDVGSIPVGFGWSFVYVAFELLGAFLAVLAFKLLRPEDFGGEPNPHAAAQSEFIGTFMLVVTVGLNVLGKSAAVAYSVGACYMCMVYALGDTSGGHFNPAVTFAMWRVRPMDWTGRKLTTYLVVQLVSGSVAGLMYALVYHGGSFKIGPSGEKRWWQVGIAEVAFTFVLCFAVLCVSVSPKTKQPVMFGLVVGACITVGETAIGPISGGALNPAVAFGIAVPFQVLEGRGLWKALAYSAFELFGAWLAAEVFKITHAADLDKAVTMGARQKAKSSWGTAFVEAMVQAGKRQGADVPASARRR